MTNKIKYAAIVTIALVSTACGNKNQAVYDEYHSSMCVVQKISQDITKGITPTPESTAILQKAGMRNIELAGEIMKLSADPDHTAMWMKALDMTTCSQSTYKAPESNAAVPSAAQSSPEGFLSSMTAKWDQGSYLYSNNKLVGARTNGRFVITPNGKFDQANKMLPVKLQVYSEIDLMTPAQVTFDACGHKCIAKNENELSQIKKKLSEVTTALKLGATSDALLYNPSVNPNAVQMSLKTTEGEVLFEANFVSKLTDSDTLLLNEFAKTGIATERNKLIDEVLAHCVDEIEKEYDSNSPAPAPTPTPAPAPAPSKVPLAPAPAITSVSPSFDCTKASSVSEKLICSNSDLGAADIKLMQVYKEAALRSADKDALKKSQNIWRKMKRDVCSDAKCIHDAYESRIMELNASK